MVIGELICSKFIFRIPTEVDISVSYKMGDLLAIYFPTLPLHESIQLTNENVEEVMV